MHLHPHAHKHAHTQTHTYISVPPGFAIKKVKYYDLKLPVFVEKRKNLKKKITVHIKIFC